MHEPTSLRGIANRAQACGHNCFQALYRELDVDMLRYLSDAEARAKASTVEEPDAGKPHVRVCSGGAG